MWDILFYWLFWWWDILYVLIDVNLYVNCYRDDNVIKLINKNISDYDYFNCFGLFSLVIKFIMLS